MYVLVSVAIQEKLEVGPSVSLCDSSFDGVFCVVGAVQI